MRNNSKLTKNAQYLRKHMTKQEGKLWVFFLKDLPVNINRQKVIGNYIIDFYCAEKKTAIEIDGTQHFLTEGKEKDKIRDNYLNSLGIKVLRYSNYDINENFESVTKDIWNKLKLG